MVGVMMMRELVKIGSISSAKGLKGEFKVFPENDEIFYLEIGDKIFIEGVFEDLVIEKISEYKNMVTIKLKNYNHIDQIKKLKNQGIFIDKQDSKVEEEEGLSAREVIGFAVINNSNDENLGEVINSIGSSSQEVLVVNKDEKEWMIPFVEAFIEEIDEEEKVLRVSVIEGMI
jgi:16S rRNA processing protein RimM